MNTDITDIQLPDEVSLQANDLISGIIHQVSELSKVNTFPELLTEKEYDDADDPRSHIDDATKKAEDAKKKYNEYKEIPAPKFYQLTKWKNKKVKEEKQQEMYSDIIDAVDGNVSATKGLFNQIIRISSISRDLYALGLMSVASNRIVVREIRARLANASQNEIDELAVQELQNVLDELNHQKSLEDKIETSRKDIETLKSQAETDKSNNEEKVSQIKKDISSQGESIRALSQKVTDNINNISEKIGANNDKIENLKDSLESLTSKSKTDTETLHKDIIDVKKSSSDLIYKHREEFNRITVEIGQRGKKLITWLVIISILLLVSVISEIFIITNLL